MYVYCKIYIINKENKTTNKMLADKNQKKQ